MSSKSEAKAAESKAADSDKAGNGDAPRGDVPYGTLDLMVLKTLESMGSLHGYGIARRIEQVADGVLSLNQGTIYPSLLRLEQRGWISSSWGVSENNRRARFYAITRSGRRQLAGQAEEWERMTTIVSRLLRGVS
jgi:PadR family transcriptional regulator, regulatory protein PadR